MYIKIVDGEVRIGSDVKGSVRKEDGTRETVRYTDAEMRERGYKPLRNGGLSGGRPGPGKKAVWRIEERGDEFARALYFEEVKND